MIPINDKFCKTINKLYIQEKLKARKVKTEKYQEMKT